MFELLLILVVCVNAQYPPECGGSNICCPTTPLTNLKCGGPSRGRCTDIRELPINVAECKRGALSNFDFVCVCESNFAGPDCGSCRHGWTGPDCTTPNVLVRRNWQSLSQIEREQFVYDMFLLKQSILYESVNDEGVALSYYDFFTFLHYNSGFYLGSDWAHEGPAFLTWHRNFLLHFERLAQTLTANPQWTVPYWDWTDPHAKEVISYFGGNGTKDIHNASGGKITKSPWNQWYIVGEHGKPLADPSPRRCLGCYHPLSSLPDLRAVEEALAAPIYDSQPWNSSTVSRAQSSNYAFRKSIEGTIMAPTSAKELNRDLHDRVHVYLGGFMGQVPFAANDPLFVLHHSYVDYIFEKWLQTHPEELETGFLPNRGARIGHNKLDCIYPYLPVTTNAALFRPSLELGYTYDVFIPSDD